MNEKNLLKEGDVIEIKKGHEVYVTIPKHFIYDNCIGDFELDQSKIVVGPPRSGMTRQGLDTSYLVGKYIVTKAYYTGGGQAHDGHVPDGWKVYCKKVVEHSYDHRAELSFFQTGGFTAMIEDINPIGRAEAEWKIFDSHLKEGA